MESYIVRIYRRRRARDGDELVGLVEAADGQGRQAFHTPEELWAILARSANGAAPCPAFSGPRAGEK